MRLLLNALLSAAVVYAAILVLVFVFQARLVYFPQAERVMVATPLALGATYEDVELQAADGTRLHGWWIPVRSARGAVLLFHGNAGNISHRLDYVAMFARLGYATLMIDYRGYGQSAGTPDEPGTYQDAEAAWRHLVEARGVTPRDIVIVGESLGGGVATWLAAQHAPRALILASTFTSVPELGAQVYPWLPVRLLSRIRYGNLERIGSIDAPILIAHSRDDDVIPYAHGAALFAAAGPRATLLVLNGGHNEGMLYSRAEWGDTVRSFLERAATGVVAR